MKCILILVLPGFSPGKSVPRDVCVQFNFLLSMICQLLRMLSTAAFSFPFWVQGHIPFFHLWSFYQFGLIGLCCSKMHPLGFLQVIPFRFDIFGTFFFDSQSFVAPLVSLGIIPAYGCTSLLDLWYSFLSIAFFLAPWVSRLPWILYTWHIEHPLALLVSYLHTDAWYFPDLFLVI